MLFQIGPLRCWPGGLCLSRSIGDMDVGEYIIPVPYVKQVKVWELLLRTIFYHAKVNFIRSVNDGCQGVCLLSYA